MSRLTYMVKRALKMDWKRMWQTAGMLTEKSGKSRAWLLADMAKCAAKYNAGYVDYKIAQMYRLNDAQRRTVITRGISNNIVRRMNDKAYWFNFDDKTTARMRHFIRMRYKLLPYMYTEFVHAVKTLTPLCTPTAFYDKSCQSLECQDEFFLGRSVLVAPVYQPNAQGRNVFLAGNRPYLYVKYCNNGLENFNVVQAGNFYAEYSTDEVAFFIKENCGIVAGVLEDAGKTFNSVEIIAFVSGVATTSYYEDDGETNNYLSDDFFQIDFTIKKENSGTFNIQANTQGNRTPEIKNFNFVIVDENAKVTRQTFSL